MILNTKRKMQLPKEQSIRSKLGSILGIGSSRTTPVPQRNLEDLSKLEHNTFFTADVLRVICKCLEESKQNNYSDVAKCIGTRQ